jgi:hypothetical protein
MSHRVSSEEMFETLCKHIPSSVNARLFRYDGIMAFTERVLKSLKSSHGNIEFAMIATETRQYSAAMVKFLKSRGFQASVEPKNENRGYDYLVVSTSIVQETEKEETEKEEDDPKIPELLD